MIIAIDKGHTLKGADYGAVGNLVESKETRVVGDKVIAKLKDLGHKVIDCTVDNASLQARVNKEKAQKCDMFISIHFNAGGGVGTEIYVLPSASVRTREKAENILKEVVKSCDFKNRGVKQNNFYVLRNTNSPAMLLEVCFVDTDDYLKYDSGKIANAIVRGITGQVATDNKPEEVKPSNPENNKPNNTMGTVQGYNATIVNDFLYTRDSNGNKDGGRIDIGDKVKVVDVSYSKQLIKVEYPVQGGTKIAYATNAVNCIKYLYQDQYKNGSTIEPVYEDAGCKRKIGALDSYEKATPLYRNDGKLHVVYTSGKVNNTKSGYVKYSGGFNKF